MIWRALGRVAFVLVILRVAPGIWRDAWREWREAKRNEVDRGG